jgi:shikimate kinase
MMARSDSGKRGGRGEPAPDLADPERPIALVGLMGAGKSAVGRLLAAHLGRPFADTDVLIEAEAARSIADLFAGEGEAAFRARERRWIQRIPVELRGHVVALGGGMFVGEENVARIRACAVAVWLRAQVDTLLERLGPAAFGDRPLLGGGDPRTRLAELLAARAPWYEQAHLVVDTDGRDAEAVAAAVAEGVAGMGQARAAREQSGRTGA